MFVALLLALQATTQQPVRRPAAPQRPLADPGVIAVEQRVTPAGVQSVFYGKVAGVRFGKNPGELWVVVPEAAYRLAWRDNRAITSSAFDGRAGVHGVAIDPVTGRAIVSSVGKLAGNAAQSRTPGQGPLAKAEAVAHVKAYSRTPMLLLTTRGPTARASSSHRPRSATSWPVVSGWPRART